MSLFAKFASVGGATSVSRVLGFVREAMIAATLGDGPVADAFFAAFRFPNLFRRLFAEGAFNSAFVPLFAKEVEANGREEAAKFAGEVFSALFVVLALLTVAAIIFMPFLVATIIAPGYADTPEKFTLTGDLARIMFPYLAAMSLVAMLSGILNSFRSYFLAALAPVLLNLVLIGVLATALFMDLPARETGFALATGVVVSGLLQLGVLLYGMKKVGFAFRPRKISLSPKVRRLLVLAAPAALTGGIVQVNIVIGQIIASRQDGAVAWLQYADRIYQLPLGIIGIAIGVVLLPELARALSAKADDAVHSLQNRSLEFALALTVPAAVALMIIPAPIVTVLFERGQFTAETTAATAAALAAFAVGLPSFVLIKVFQPAFFAREDMRTPMWISLIAVIVNVAASLILSPVYGHVGIAIATSLSGWANAASLAIILWQQRDFQPSAETLSRTVKVIACAAAMGAALYGLLAWQGAIFANAGIFMQVVMLAATVVIAMVIYFSLAIASNAIDRAALMAVMRRKRGAT